MPSIQKSEFYEELFASIAFSILPVLQTLLGDPLCLHGSEKYEFTVPDMLISQKTTLVVPGAKL